MDKKRKLTYMVLPTPSEALVSFERHGKKIGNVRVYEGGKWIDDTEHGDLLETAARIGALRKMGEFVELDEAKILMKEKRAQSSSEEADV